MIFPQIRLNAQGGLTLIELIVAIVILGILSVGATALIVRSVQTYQTNRAAGELASQGEMALTVMTRELHNAQPGTLKFPNGGASLSFKRCAAPPSAAAASVCSGGYGFAMMIRQLPLDTILLQARGADGGMDQTRRPVRRGSFTIPYGKIASCPMDRQRKPRVLEEGEITL